MPANERGGFEFRAEPSRRFELASGVDLSLLFVDVVCSAVPLRWSTYLRFVSLVRRPNLRSATGPQVDGSGLLPADSLLQEAGLKAVMLMHEGREVG
jgi:hypothetical protein